MTATIITAIIAGLPGLITAVGALFLHRQNVTKIQDLHEMHQENASKINALHASIPVMGTRR